ncbi:hypothetical protein DFH09DRAFT_1088074 [Mycena vulgaris]|nr:hypothetical protein DFH09DRAFT_1088074 [Mycena vulgaris]
MSRRTGSPWAHRALVFPLWDLRCDRTELQDRIGADSNSSDPLEHFWPARATRKKLEFAQGCVYRHVHPVLEMAIGASGTYILLQVQGEEASIWASYTSLQPCTAQDVSESSGGMALDDSLGLVFIFGTIVNVISYV